MRALAAGCVVFALLTLGCEVAPGVSEDLQSGTLLAKIDGIAEFDLTGGVLQKMRKVGTGADNRWTRFVEGARAACGGEDPTSFALRSVQLELDTSESSIGSFQEVFSGPVALQLRDESSGLTVVIGSRFDVTGQGPVSFNVVGGRAALEPLAASMIAGDFSVGLIAEAGDVATSFDMTVLIPLDVRAFCEDSAAE